MTDFFADSYAFISAIDGSSKYRDLLAGGDFVTTRLNAVEVAQAILLRGGGESHLQTALPPILEKCVEPEAPVVARAAIFRRRCNAAGGRISTVDAWGYATAQSLGLEFVTGDEAFRGVPGVKFVKG